MVREAEMERPRPKPRTRLEQYFVRWASLTWYFADWKKRSLNCKNDYTDFIKTANKRYLYIGIFSALVHILLTRNNLKGEYTSLQIFFHFLWSIFILSRCNEIFYAFGKDASEKAGKQPSSTLLSGRDRIILALRSYVEIIINFALLLSFLPLKGWMSGYAPKTFTDLLFYSATNITTSGNGAMIPIRYYTQFLSTYEIYAGLVLLVVCFALYSGLIGSEVKLQPPTS